MYVGERRRARWIAMKGKKAPSKQENMEGFLQNLESIEV
jgi:hypothetical protein